MISRMGVIPAGMLLPLAFALSACGGSSDPATGPGQNGDPPVGPIETTAVSVGDTSFDPSAILVDPGATVTWTWNSSLGHNVTWVEGDLTNSPTQAGGTFTQVMPATAGEHAYYCTVHGTPNTGMRGTVVVE